MCFFVVPQPRNQNVLQRSDHRWKMPFGIGVLIPLNTTPWRFGWHCAQNILISIVQPTPVASLCCENTWSERYNSNNNAGCLGSREVFVICRSIHSNGNSRYGRWTFPWVSANLAQKTKKKTTEMIDNSSHKVTTKKITPGKVTKEKKIWRNKQKKKSKTIAGSEHNAIMSIKNHRRVTKKKTYGRLRVTKKNALLFFIFYSNITEPFHHVTKKMHYYSYILSEVLSHTHVILIRITRTIKRTVIIIGVGVFVVMRALYMVGMTITKPITALCRIGAKSTANAAVPTRTTIVWTDTTISKCGCTVKICRCRTAFLCLCTAPGTIITVTTGTYYVETTPIIIQTTIMNIMWIGLPTITLCTINRNGGPKIQRRIIDRLVTIIMVRTINTGLVHTYCTTERWPPGGTAIDPISEGKHIPRTPTLLHTIFLVNHKTIILCTIIHITALTDSWKTRTTAGTTTTTTTILFERHDHRGSRWRRQR